VHDHAFLKNDACLKPQARGWSPFDIYLSDSRANMELIAGALRSSVTWRDIDRDVTTLLTKRASTPLIRPPDPD
jgi:hypothetical protein